MKAYLAARYSRLDELNGYKRELEAIGIEVPARWLKGEHRLIDGLPGPQNEGFAQDDWDDIYDADLFICFTEQPGSGAARGGRHVEFGLALCWFGPGDIYVVGPRENVFYYLPGLKVFETWAECLEALASRSSKLEHYIGGPER